MHAAGRGDLFESVEDLVTSVRPGVLLDSCMVPALSTTNFKGRPLVLNRYILDYWEHGSKKALAKGNHILVGETSSSWMLSRTSSSITMMKIELKSVLGLIVQVHRQ